MEMRTHVHTCMHTYSWKWAPQQNKSWASQGRTGKGWVARGWYHRFSNRQNLDCLRFSYSCLDQTAFSQWSWQQHVVSHFPSPTLTGHYRPMGSGHQQKTKALSKGELRQELQQIASPIVCCWGMYTCNIHLLLSRHYFWEKSMTRRVDTVSSPQEYGKVWQWASFTGLLFHDARLSF